MLPLGPLLFRSLLAFFFLHAASDSPGFMPTPPETPAHPANPYDSIRTDLSDYAWPTDAGRLVTSTFGEFRSNHFHGGIDISTGDDVGFRVFASRTGYVSRISIYPTGYGKLLFVRHPDGYTTAYAHLDRFFGAIEKLAEREQRRLGRYPIDIWCKPGDFPVNKGEQIAFTGETGTGSPHLHFEIRDENANYVNPFLCKNLQRVDNMPPVVRGIAIRPLGDKARVNGRWAPVVIPPRASDERQYFVDDTVHISGDVGFSFDARDNANESPFRSGVYMHQFFVDESLIYSVRLDRVPNADAHQIALYYDWQLLKEDEGRFAKLYMDSPNRLPFYSPRRAFAGVIHAESLSIGLHGFTCVATDFNNNQAVVQGHFVVSPPPRFSLKHIRDLFELQFEGGATVRAVRLFSKGKRTGGWDLLSQIAITDTGERVASVPVPKGKHEVFKLIAVDVRGQTSLPRYCSLRAPGNRGGGIDVRTEFESDYVRVVVHTEGEFTSEPRVTVHEGGAAHALACEQGDAGSFVGTFRPSPAIEGVRRVEVHADVSGTAVRTVRKFTLHPIVSGATGVLPIDGGVLQIGYDSSSVFRTVFLRVEKDDAATRSYSLEPGTTVLNNGVKIMMRADPSNRRQALYFRSGSRWSLLSTQRESNGKFLAGRLSRTFGDVAVRTDVAAPAMSRLKIRSPRGGKTSLSFRYSDDLSGVDYNELKLYLDGTLCIPEIDGEHRTVSYQVPQTLTRGSHSFRIRLQDRIGNGTEVARRFSVR